jgi:FAD/FMN-containing dehydrogenase
MRAVAGASVATGEQGYLALQMLFAGCAHVSPAACHTAGTATGGTLPRDSFNAGSDYVARPLDRSGRAALLGAVARRASLPGSGDALLDAYGGQINRVRRDATAFIHRDQLFCIQYLSYGAAPEWVGQARGAMRRHVSGQAYQNYIDRSLAHWQRAYYGSAYARLGEIRRRVDPEHRFNFPQAIGR